MKNMITFLIIISDIPEQILLQQTEVYLDKEKSLLYIHIYLYTVIISYYVHNSLFSKVFQSDKQRYFFITTALPRNLETKCTVIIQCKQTKHHVGYSTHWVLLYKHI